MLHLKCHLFFSLKQFVHDVPIVQVEHVKIPVHGSDSPNFRCWSGGGGVREGAEISLAVF